MLLSNRRKSQEHETENQFSIIEERTRTEYVDVGVTDVRFDRRYSMIFDSDSTC
jgi:hypothetical protein